MEARRPRLLTGDRPTGPLHLGHLVGTLQSRVQLQDSHECFIIVADLHSLTTRSQRDQVARLPQHVRDVVLDLLSVGIDPDRTTIYLQSGVPAVYDIAILLQMLTPVSRLSGMQSIHDMAHNAGLADADVPLGLLGYPVLQAADILLYKAELVPVGQDQVQHIELARRIARSFNHRWGKVFPECQPLLTATPKILGLDGQAKMSKSLGNTISLGEPEKKVRKKLASAATDPARVTREDPGNPDVCNVFTIHKAVSRDEDLAWVREGCTTAGIGCVDCKTRLADNLLAELGPYHERRAALLAAPQQVKDILYAGADKARAAAKQTMDQVREKLGLWR